MSAAAEGSVPSLSPRFALEVDGERVSIADAHSVLRVAVDESPERLDAFELVVAPDGGPGGVDDRLRLGAEVAIRAGYGDDEPEEALMEGEVTALEPSFPEGGPARLRVRGYDRLHRLRRGRATRAFRDLSDAEVVRRIAGELGLEARVEDTGDPRPYTLQRNCSDAEFLKQLARRNGCSVRVRGRALEFARPRVSAPSSLTLCWGRDLIACELRWNTVDQVSRVEVRGWDYRRKEAIVGLASLAQVDLGDGGTAGADVAARAHGGECTLRLVDGRATTQAEANRIAEAELARRAGRFGTGTGLATGLPSLRSGASVRLEGLGAFSGAWFVTATRHVFDARSGYRTSFEVARSTQR